MSSAMIEIRNLRKVYGETVALDGISFDVPQGEVLGLLGPNGAGKSTTMRVLTGYTPPTDGHVRVAGCDLAREPRRVRAVLGYLPENAPVYDEMAVWDYVSFFAEAKGLRGAARRSAVGRALEECGLTDVSRRLLMNLSKGYRQRAALAQAVVGDPRVLVLDEPTVGLDPRQTRELRDLVRGMAGRRTVVLSSHILPEVSRTCSRVVIINRGRIVAQGTPDAVRSNREGGNDVLATVEGEPAAVRACLAGLDHVSGVHVESGEGTRLEYRVEVEAGRDIRASLSQAVVAGGHRLLELRSMGLNLEDIFLSTIAQEDTLPRGEVEAPRTEI